jgi:hypothetical protein
MKRGNYRSQTIDIIALLIFKGGPSWEFLGVNQQGTDAYEIWAGAFGAPHPFAVQQLQLVASVSDDRPLQFCTTAVERANGVLSSKCFDPADQRASVLLASSE